MSLHAGVPDSPLGSKTATAANGYGFAGAHAC